MLLTNRDLEVCRGPGALRAPGHFRPSPYRRSNIKQERDAGRAAPSRRRPAPVSVAPRSPYLSDLVHSYTAERAGWQDQQGPSVRRVVIVILVSWIMVIFANFGMNAPRNGTVLGGIPDLLARHRRGDFPWTA